MPLIISGSARKESDTKKYIDLIFEGVPYTDVTLLDYKVYPYDYAEVYPTDDQFLDLAKQMLHHEVMVFATPVYWYAMSGLLKTFFDRMTDLMYVHKAIGKQLKGKRLFLLAVGASDAWPEGFEVPFRSTAEYFDMHYGGSIYFNSEDVAADRKEDMQQFLQTLNTKV